MAYKLANKTNGQEFKKYDNKVEDFDAVMFYDNLEQLKQGFICACMNEKQVNDLLECFDNRNDFIVENIDGVFYLTQPVYDEIKKDKKTGETVIIHHNGATQKNIIKKLKAGEVVDF
jgi:hypothetical protein